MRNQFSQLGFHQKPFSGQQQNVNRLMDYFRQNQPKFYRYLQSRLHENNQMEGMEDIFSKITDAATSFYSAKQQRDMVKLQTKRAEQGLPPIDMTMYSAPPIRVQVDAPEAREMARGVMSDAVASMKPYLPLIGGVIFSLIYFLKKK